jgi:hypothetical protein
MLDLPQTFQDAITITRNLGYRYLWIDSLCIIQDSTEDWELESRKMGSIYRDALLNISADAAENGQEGIFKSARRGRQKSDQVVLPCYSLKRGLRGNLYASNTYFDEEPFRDPLVQRAWVLQESIMSTRKLHYRSRQLLWECATAFYHQEAPFWNRMNDSPRSIGTMSKIPHRNLPAMLDIVARKGGGMDSNTLSWWYDQVIGHVGRSLTFKKDRFPAIATLAQEFQNGQATIMQPASKLKTSSEDFCGAARAVQLTDLTALPGAGLSISVTMSI